MERGQFTFYRSFWESIKGLPNKRDQYALVEAICEYALDGNLPKLTASQNAIFVLVKPVLDTGRKKAENGKQGGSKREANEKQTEANGKQTESKTKQGESKPQANGKQTASKKEKEKEKELEIENEIEIEVENDSSPKPSQKKKFRVPTVSEVAAYCQERNNGIDAQRFVDHYQAKGWKVGKEPMQDWQAAVRTWERKDNASAPAAPAGRTLDSQEAAAVRAMMEEDVDALF